MIYGENAAGKSGYARVIKKACRARGDRQAIKPDAYHPTASGPARAKIAFRAGSVDCAVDWEDGVGSDARLGNVFVFDSHSARAYVREEDAASFTPRGLDVLHELVSACDTIKLRLQSDIDAIREDNRKIASTWTYKASTKVGQLINAVGPETRLESIDTMAVFTEADEKQLTEISATLVTDPRIKSNDTMAAAARLRAFAQTAKGHAASVDDTQMMRLEDALTQAETAARAAEAASGLVLIEGDLPGSGDAVWRKLWDAAREFSISHVYPGREFPNTEPGAACVLCQQPLQAAAVDRFARFNAFVADHTRARAEEAREKIESLKPGANLLRAIMPRMEEIRADLDREQPGFSASVEAYSKSVDARIAHAKACVGKDSWTPAPALKASPLEELTKLAEALEARAASEAATADPEKRREAESTRDELTDRKWLASKKGEVKEQIERHKRIATLVACQRDCPSVQASNKAKELEGAYGAEKFCEAFRNECEKLELRSLPVSLNPTRVVKGEGRYRLVLDGAPSARVEDVASEGEHRCIALAAFLAELSLASHQSALVFDDPVSSLDHKWRDAIARRLVEESAKRQVIIFTHDLALVCDLERAAGDAEKKFTYRQVERIGDRPGRVLPRLAWAYSSPEQQMRELKDLIGRAVKLRREKGDSEYREYAQMIIGRLRGACEALVEKPLLNDAVKRHDSQVLVSRTPGIAVVTKEHWEAIHVVWKACSNTTESHATPVSGPKNVPSPEEFNQFVSTIERVLDEVKSARELGKNPARVEAKPATIAVLPS